MFQLKMYVLCFFKAFLRILQKSRTFVKKDLDRFDSVQDFGLELYKVMVQSLKVQNSGLQFLSLRLYYQILLDVQSLEFRIRVQTLGLEVQSLDFRIRAQDSGLELKSLGFRIRCVEIRIQDQSLIFGIGGLDLRIQDQSLGFRIRVEEFRIQDQNCRVQDLGLRILF